MLKGDCGKTLQFLVFVKNRFPQHHAWVEVDVTKGIGILINIPKGLLRIGNEQIGFPRKSIPGYHLLKTDLVFGIRSITIDIIGQRKPGNKIIILVYRKIGKVLDGIIQFRPTYHLAMAQEDTKTTDYQSISKFCPI